MTNRFKSPPLAPPILFRAGKRKNRGGGFSLRLLLILLLAFVWWRSRRRAAALPVEEEPREITISGLRWPSRQPAQAPQAAAEEPPAAAARASRAEVFSEEPLVAAAHEAPAMEESPAASAPEAPAIEEAPAASDDLTVIEGIGPKINAILQAAGIHTYRQLAEAPQGRLDEILQASGLRLANPETWPEQARLAASADWDGLKSLQSRLKGGRQVG